MAINFNKISNIFIFFGLLLGSTIALKAGQFEIEDRRINEILSDQSVNLEFDDHYFQGLPILYYLAHFGHTEGIRKLLAHDTATPNFINALHPTSKGTALHEAAYFGHADACAALIEKKANVNAVDGNGITPLHCAIESRDADTCRVLVHAGADINAKNQSGDTPLSMVADNESLKYILEGKTSSKDEASGEPLTGKSFFCLKNILIGGCGVVSLGLLGYLVKTQFLDEKQKEQAA